jgi:CubicO group peptidase (beta-lactamase class C family)
VPNVFVRLLNRPGGGRPLPKIVLAGGLAAAVVLLARGRPVEAPPAGPLAAAEEAYTRRFDAESLERVVEPVRAQVEAGAFPGAAVAIGIGSREVYLREIGHIGWTRNAPPVSGPETQYDLASVTKVVATASAVMLLVDEGRMALDDPVSKFLRGFDEGPKSAVTIRHLLTHSSGLPAGAILRGNSRSERIATALRFPIYPPAGARVEYSDVGFVLLWEAAERAAGEPLTAYLERKLYQPLGMNSTRFSPGLDCEACAPTGRLRDQSLYRGRPFDPIAQRLDGVGGSAGLFSTAGDLGRFMAMIANGGELDGVRILSPEAAAEFVGPQPVGRGRFRLGWEVFCDDSIAEPDEECVGTETIGHTGWTGTSIHLDPETGLWIVLLTNRTYEPRAPNRLRQVRHEVFGRARETAATGGYSRTGSPEADTGG